jgi:hypothetical protein
MDSLMCNCTSKPAPRGASRNNGVCGGGPARRAARSAQKRRGLHRVFLSSSIPERERNERARNDGDGIAAHAPSRASAMRNCASENDGRYYPAAKRCGLFLSSSFRGVRRTSPESITTIVSMDSLMCNCTSKPAPNGAPRNDGEAVLRPPHQGRVLRCAIAHRRMTNGFTSAARSRAAAARSAEPRS